MTKVQKEVLKQVNDLRATVLQPILDLEPVRES